VIQTEVDAGKQPADLSFAHDIILIDERADKLQLLTDAVP